MLNLKELREKSVKRAIEGFNCYSNVPITFWTTALAGELGELCNMIKKLERFKVGGLDAGTNEKAKDITLTMLKEEIGGIVIYLDLLSSLIGVDLEEAVIDTFNEKSAKYDLKIFLSKPISCNAYPNCDCSGTCQQAIEFGHPHREEFRRCVNEPDYLCPEQCTNVGENCLKSIEPERYEAIRQGEEEQPQPSTFLSGRFLKPE